MTEELRDAYRLLELEPGASPERVKEAWREFAKVWHPDRFPNDPKLQEKGNEKLKEINEAYQRITAYQSGGGSDLRAGAAQRAREAAEAKAREEARREAEERARRLAEEKRKAEERLAAEARAREEAVRLAWECCQAAENGEAWAQTCLGWYYEQGQGVPQDKEEAYKWYCLAAAQGDADAVRNRDSLKRRLTRQQIAEGERRAAEFGRGDRGSGTADKPSHPKNPAPAKLVWVPPGRFTMGSPDDEQGRYADEGPQTVVRLTKGFFIGVTEVTQWEYAALMGTNPSQFRGDPNRPVERVTWHYIQATLTRKACRASNRPVEQVTWHEANEYCTKLTERYRLAKRLPAGWAYRLPTEAEWEYTCRAGTTTRFSFGDDPDYTKLREYAWFHANSGRMTHPVGLKRSNRWGLKDMHGNVWEWCLDWYGKYPGGSVIDPTGPASGSTRVIRGGSWGIEGRGCRSANRRDGTPDDPGNYIGFRVVLAPG